jgi:phosphoesterase RecJ-like protein
MPSVFRDLLAIDDDSRRAIRALDAELKPGRRVALTTHVNADGDGCGSEAALGHLLTGRGLDVRIVNPTPWPAMYRFLLDGTLRERSAEGTKALAGIDVLIVLDVSDVKRLGALAECVRALKVPRLVIDHHIASDEPAGSIRLTNTAACATGELVFDFACELGLPITEPVAKSLYAAILTDTGGFRFSNTTPRCHAVAARLLAAGVDPEEMYRQIYASVSIGKLRLLGDALDTLEADVEAGIAWLSVPAGAPERYGVTSEDFDGIVEHARSVAGTRLALFFRDLGYGKVKVSFRSVGDVDVNTFARQFGGGGHAKASGALVAGTLEEVRERVVAAAQEYLQRDQRARS